MRPSKSLLRSGERTPEHEEAWEALEALYASTGDYEKILDMRRMWVEHAGGASESVDRLETLIRDDGAQGYWNWRMDVLHERESDEENRVSPVYMAAAQVAMGDTEGAFASLDEAVRVRDRRLASLRTDPVWDVMRSDPRFVDLVRRITDARPPGRGRPPRPPNLGPR